MLSIAINGSKLPEAMVDINLSSNDSLQVKMLKEEVVSLRSQLAEVKIKVKALERSVFAVTTDAPEKESTQDQFEHIKKLLRDSASKQKTQTGMSALDRIERQLQDLLRYIADGDEVNNGEKLIHKLELAERGGEIYPCSPVAKGKFFAAAASITITDFGGRPSLTTGMGVEDEGVALASPRTTKFMSTQLATTLDDESSTLSNWLFLPCEVSLDSFKITECRDMSQEQVDFVKSTLKSAIAEQTKLHRVASKIISAMRANYSGNWVCNIRCRDEQAGLRFHGTKQGLFLSFSYGPFNYRLQLNEL